MCTYIQVPTVPTVPKKLDTEFDDMTIEELNILKGSLMKEFLSGGMKDKNLMHKINNIRNHITAQEH